jgi:RepB DNA-primase N-terminal domain
VSADATKILTALFGQPADGELIDVRVIRKGKPPLEKFFPVSNIAEAAEYATSQRANGDVSVGVLPRVREKGGRDDVGSARVIWADCDSPEAVAALEEFPLQPSAVVMSGSGENRHVYFLLADAIESEAIEQRNRRLASALGSDPRVCDAARVLRVPGTLNHKHDPPTDVRLAACSGMRYTLEEADAVLPPIAPVDRSPKHAAVAPTAPSNPTEVVLARLHGVHESGNGWMALCPAHADSRPSLSIAEAEDGRCLLHCFAGCTPEGVVAAIGLTMPDLFGDDGEDHQRSSLSDLLVKIAEDAGVRLFHDSAHVAYARVPVADHVEVWAINSRTFRRWLRRELRREYGRLAKADAINEAVEYLSAEAEFDDPELEVHLRTAWTNGGFAYSLADDQGRAVMITPTGWSVGTTDEVAFLRRASVLPIPAPATGGAIELLRRYVNVQSEDDFILVVAWLTMALRPTGPYPVLVIQGQQGSAKSTLSRVLKALTDPVKAPIRSLPGGLRDLAIAAESNWVIVIDNLSLLNDGMSDAFCRLATGGGFATRALYTDDEERIFDQMRPVILNGIDAIVTRQDLLGRSIVIRLPKIKRDARIDEATFWANFEADQPLIVGALIDAAGVALARWEATEVVGLRMADFARWAAGSMPAFGRTADEFARAYEENLSGAMKASLEGSLLAAVVARVVGPSVGSCIRGRPTEVHAALRAAMKDEEQSCAPFPNRRNP